MKPWIVALGDWWVPSSVPKAMVDTRLGSMILSPAVDSGCAQTMLKVNLVLAQVGTEEGLIQMVGIHGESYRYKTRIL